MVFQGKATYRNLSRYCGFHEKRFARWSRRFFDFAKFNRQLLQHELPSKSERFESIETTEDGVEIYSAVVEAKNGKRKLRVVLLRWEKKEEGTVGTAILFSTDPELSASKIVEYYRARFQIEFLFRDAKQHTGLMDCQARSSEAIQMHINASFMSLNLLKLEDRREK